MLRFHFDVPLCSLNQLLVNESTVDSINVSTTQTTFMPGVDYMTDYNKRLRIQVRLASNICRTLHMCKTPVVGVVDVADGRPTDGGYRSIHQR